MSYKTKLKIKEFCDRYVNANNIKLLLLALPLSFILIDSVHNNEFVITDYLDINILVSFLILFFCEIIARILSGYIARKTEDVVKLTKDYTSLIDKYSRAQLYQYVNDNDKIVILPSIVISIRGADTYQLDIDNSNCKKKYELPKQIADNSSKLMSAHSKSVVYNSQTLKIDSLTETGKDRVKIVYSQTTYFDTLLTNRAMDFSFKDGKSIREIYEPGPFFSSLEDSKFSNHLGYIGFVETADEKIIFVKRSNKVSTAKELWQASISASFKTKYGLEDDQTLSESGISKAIKKEMEDELAIIIADDVELDKTIIGFYRDLVEGGKPHFVFYYKVPNTFATQFKSDFKSMIDSKKPGDVTIDGSVVMLIDKKDLLNATLDIDSFKINSEVYHMDSSMITSLAIWIEHNKKLNIR